MTSPESLEIEVELGLRAGQRNVPINVAGCYVPAGRFAHIASALMSVTTASAAGVGNIVVASPARPGPIEAACIRRFCTLRALLVPTGSSDSVGCRLSAPLHSGCSPVWLVTTSGELTQAADGLCRRHAEDLPDPS